MFSRNKVEKEPFFQFYAARPRSSVLKQSHHIIARFVNSSKDVVAVIETSGKEWSTGQSGEVDKPKISTKNDERGGEDVRERRGEGFWSRGESRGRKLADGRGGSVGAALNAHAALEPCC